MPNSTYFGSFKHGKLIFGIVILLIFIALAFRIFLAPIKNIGKDEFVSLHSSWLISQGKVPYRDFLISYPPTLGIFLYPLFKLFNESIAIIFISRYIILFFDILIAIAVYKIAKEFFDNDIAILSVLALLYEPIFFHKGMQIRPDVPMTFFWLISFYLIIKGIDKSKNLFLAGLSLGIGFCFKQYMLIGLLTLLVSVMIYHKYTGVNGIKRIFTQQFTILVGFSLPLIILLGYLHFNNAMGNFAYLNFKAYIELTYSHTLYEKIQLFLRKALIDLFFWGSTFFILLIKTNDLFKNKLPSKEIFLLTPFFIFLPAIFLFIYSWEQYYLPLIPIASIYVGLIIEKILNIKSGSFHRYILITFLLVNGILAPMYYMYWWTTQRNYEQIETINYVLSITTPEDCVFDRMGMYIFRNHAYGHWVIAIPIIRDPGLSKIPKSLEKGQCKVIIDDGFIKDLPKNVQDYVGEHYVSTGRYNVLVRKD